MATQAIDKYLSTLPNLALPVSVKQYPVKN
jgi:hypothetical protein